MVMGNSLAKSIRQVHHNNKKSYQPTTMYQFSILQTPTGIQKQIEITIGKFLLQGGRTKTKQNNLHNQKKSIAPYEQRGIAIKHYVVMNLVMGEKRTCRLIVEGPTWWNKVLEEKYTNSKRQQLIQAQIPSKPCSHIWKLYNKKIHSSHSSPHLQNSSGDKISIFRIEAS